ncbi:MAG TPA: hydrolase 1, exosortase A system-associated [Acidiferrobacterales bacterium]
MTTASELAVRIDCQGDAMIGVVHCPPAPRRRGVVVVVGGPQYRVGSHRQFLLLARALAADGYAVLRFDCRGMGDSCGAPRDFETIEPDMRAAIDTLCARVPQVQEVGLWGLCDAASAIMMYAPRDARVTGLAVLNPWVRSEAGLARSYLRNYYLRRFLDRVFWRRVFAGEVAIGTALSSFFDVLQRGFGGRGDKPASAPDACADAIPFPQRMLDGLRAFRGRVLLVLSGDDLTAGEFKALVRSARPWRRILRAGRVTRHDLVQANHTFARRDWRDQVARWTAVWLASW